MSRVAKKKSEGKDGVSMKSFALSCVFKTDLIRWILCAPAMLAPTLDPTPASHQPIRNRSLTQPSRFTYTQSENGSGPGKG